MCASNKLDINTKNIFNRSTEYKFSNYTKYTINRITSNSYLFIITTKSTKLNNTDNATMQSWLFNRATCYATMPRT